MNRRKALATLVAMPALARIASAGAITSGDVIVAELSERISVDESHRLKEHLKTIWPDNRIVVCGPQVRLKILPK
jgi:hypothetical protein